MRCLRGGAVLLAVLLAVAAPSWARDEAVQDEPDFAATACAVETQIADVEGRWEEHRAAEDDGSQDTSVERIYDFHSRVVIDADGGLTVTETISVEAAGDQIKRGIYRDFPTLYGDGPFGTRRGVPFDVVAVERDGQAEPFHTTAVDNGVRIYIGDADVEVAHGRHDYRVTYRTGLQLGFFADHDELYWNVTGNGWALPIDHAGASVELPPGVPRDSIRLEGYTGPFGDTAHNLTTSVGRDGVLHFTTTQPLARYEGLTIVASFAKGFVRPPTKEEQNAAWLHANRHILAGAAGLGVVVLYYLVVWVAIGRDPRRGVIIPQFEPPTELDAPGVRYVRRMGYDERCFTAALVSLAVKGWVRIDDADGDFTLHRINDRHAPLSGAESRMQTALFGGAQSLELKQTNHSRLRSAIQSLTEGLQREYERKFFRANRRWVIPGLVLSAGAILALAWYAPGPGIVPTAFILIWLSVWSFACLQLVEQVRRGWRDAIRPGVGVFSRILAVFLALIVTAFALPFFFGELAGLWFMTQTASFWAAPLAATLGVINWLFLYLLKQPTRAGQTLIDQIDGLRMYLVTAEGDELRHAPPKTPARFEQMLPYAIALGVEHQWSERFADVLRNASEADRSSYQPVWYSGRSFSSIGANAFTSMVSSSLSSAVASSSTAPGSSSGSSGGGSSGGGGGGGGGGGW